MGARDATLATILDSVAVPCYHLRGRFFDRFPDLWFVDRTKRLCSRLVSRVPLGPFPLDLGCHGLATSAEAQAELVSSGDFVQPAVGQSMDYPGIGNVVDRQHPGLSDFLDRREL